MCPAWWHPGCRGNPCITALNSDNVQYPLYVGTVHCCIHKFNLGFKQGKTETKSLYKSSPKLLFLLGSVELWGNAKWAFCLTKQNLTFFSDSNTRSPRKGNSSLQHCGFVDVCYAKCTSRRQQHICGDAINDRCYRWWCMDSGNHTLVHHHSLSTILSLRGLELIPAALRQKSILDRLPAPGWANIQQQAAVYTHIPT